MCTNDKTIEYKTVKSKETLTFEEIKSELIKIGTLKGYLAYDEVNRLLPKNLPPASIEDVINVLMDNNIELVDDDSVIEKKDKKLQSISEFLEAGEFDKANKLLELIQILYSTNCDFWLYKMMCDLKVRFKHELSDIDYTPLEKTSFFSFVLYYSDEKLYDELIEANKSTCYNYALRLSKSCKYKDLIESVYFFEKLANYKDSNEQYNKIINRLNQAISSYSSDTENISIVSQDSPTCKQITSEKQYLYDNDKELDLDKLIEEVSFNDSGKNKNEINNRTTTDDKLEETDYLRRLREYFNSSLNKIGFVYYTQNRESGVTILRSSSSIINEGKKYWFGLRKNTYNDIIKLRFIELFCAFCCGNECIVLLPLGLITENIGYLKSSIKKDTGVMTHWHIYLHSSFDGKVIWHFGKSRKTPVDVTKYVIRL